MTRSGQGHRSTSWEELGWTESGGARVSRGIQPGASEDPDSPIVFLAEFPPGFRVEPHSHEADYLEIILKGSIEVTRRVHSAGDIRSVRAGTAYGPLIAGPEGCTFLVIFADSRWHPIPVTGKEFEPGTAGVVRGLVDLMGASRVRSNASPAAE